MISSIALFIAVVVIAPPLLFAFLMTLYAVAVSINGVFDHYRED